MGSSSAYSPWVADDSCSPAASSSLRQPQQDPRSTCAAARCEAILRWPVFKGLIDERDADIQSFLFEVDGADDSSDSTPTRPMPGIDEDAFVPLCRKFLMHVYPRNPILDKEALVSYAKDAAANGLKWNAKSCLVVGAPVHRFHPSIHPSVHRGILDTFQRLLANMDHPYSCWPALSAASTTPWGVVSKDFVKNGCRDFRRARG